MASTTDPHLCEYAPISPEQHGDTVGAAAAFITSFFATVYDRVRGFFVPYVRVRVRTHEIVFQYGREAYYIRCIPGMQVTV
jgi:hypothetical protein